MTDDHPLQPLLFSSESLSSLAVLKCNNTLLRGTHIGLYPGQQLLLCRRTASHKVSAVQPSS
jgi:hypothetical protein